MRTTFLSVPWEGIAVTVTLTAMLMSSATTSGPVVMDTRVAALALGGHALNADV